MTAPERIWATYGGDMLYLDPTQGTWRSYGDRGAEYILHTRAALAASPVVQDMIRQAVDAEVEACAKVADVMAGGVLLLGGAAELSDGSVYAVRRTAESIAAAIRARKGE